MTVERAAAVRRHTVRRAGEGRTIAVVGDVYRFLATGDETDGKFAMFEAFVPPGGGPPPHVHSREEEAFYILEGTVTFRVGDAVIRAEAGTHVTLPVGVPHGFANETHARARMLITMAPAGLEEMFFEVSRPVPEETTTTEPPTPEEIGMLLAAAPRYGITILGP